MSSAWWAAGLEPNSDSFRAVSEAVIKLTGRPPYRITYKSMNLYEAQLHLEQRQGEPYAFTFLMIKGEAIRQN